MSRTVWIGEGGFESVENLGASDGLPREFRISSFQRNRTSSDVRVLSPALRATARIDMLRAVP